MAWTYGLCQLSDAGKGHKNTNKPHVLILFVALFGESKLHGYIKVMVFSLKAWIISHDYFIHVVVSLYCLDIVDCRSTWVLNQRDSRADRFASM